MTREPTPVLRVLVVDDELLARRRLARLLAAMPDVRLCGEHGEAASALGAIAGGEIDVVLLDIEMPGLSGIEALRLLPEARPQVIFCTAHAVHAVAAFEVGAVDYLLKPIEPGRLQRGLERARARLLASSGPPGASSPPGPAAFAGSPPAAPPLAAAAALPAPLDRLAVSTRRGIVLIDPHKVTHAVLESELVTLHTSEGEFICDFTLQELWERLPRDRFERVHRRAVINLEHVSRLEPTETGGYLARMPGDQVVEVSRQAARELRRRLGLR